MVPDQVRIWKSAPPLEPPITADGFANFGFTQDLSFYSRVCMPSDVPVSFCMANLKLFACEATVGEISDCVLTVAHSAPAVHGCGRFLQAAHCEQTIFFRLENNTEAGTGGCGLLKVR
jgi:hypothetical protein